MTTSLNKKNSLSWRIFGPGILLATGAIGGSHLISSTQAGAIFGWQLAIMIILANFFKYPFFRFSTDYVYDTGESLIAGYAKKSPVYLWIYFILLLGSAIISVGAVSLLAAVILSFMLPESLKLSMPVLGFIVLIAAWLLLVIGKYKLLDRLNKWIMASLTVATIIAVFIAAGKPTVVTPDFVPPSPWNLATLGFIVALMGWMPAPLEFAAMSSMWTTEKLNNEHTTHKQGLIDFNAGYISSAILALFFLALGVYVQYGSGIEVEKQGAAYVTQLINMYTATIGDWSKLLVAFVAFMVMFSTTIACSDGYGRSLAECIRLFKQTDPVRHNDNLQHIEKVYSSDKPSNFNIFIWTTYTVIGALVIILFFKAQLGILLKFAMISAFVCAPIFGWLNYSLVKTKYKLSTLMNLYSIAGLLFLGSITLLFIAQLFKII